MKCYQDKEYWEMCQRAGEIQARWLLTTGDWVFSKETGEPFVVVDACIFDAVKLRNGESGVDSIQPHINLIWLPTQEDLQEMITDKGYFRFSLVERFYHFANKHANKFNSMTKLWLAFVMHELYAKTWNPEKKEWEK